MTFDRIQLEATGVVVRVYKLRNSEATLPMPAGKEAPANTVSIAWDAETLTLTCTLDDGGTQEITLTTEDIGA